MLFKDLMTWPKMNKIESLDLWKGGLLSTVNEKVMLSTVKANKARKGE